MTTGLRRSISYVDETVPEAYQSRAHYSAPDWQVDAWVSTYTAIRAGELERVSDDVETITGRPATSLAQLLIAAGED
jgi:NAD(P)H dehydrogenase (quinone)